MLVSPLAWLLAEIGAEDLTWAAEQPDVLSRGSVAHAVFERLFPKGPVLNAAALIDAFEGAFTEAIADKAQFFDLPDWDVDRRHFATETARAARAWRDLLEAGGFEIEDAEAELSGVAHGLQLRGTADALLTLPSGHKLVVDYKSGGSRSRRERMREGWDLQARLYMDMLGAMGREVHGVSYFCLGDATFLAWASDDVPHAERFDDDVAREAFGRLSELLAVLRDGILPLNHDDDAKTFGKLGIGAYALGASPLILAHAVPGDGA
jgi:RecB family exonuclease